MTMNDRYMIGNAQTIGCREIQSNFFSTAYNEDGDLFAVLADGAIDHPNGRAAAVVAVESCVSAFRQKLFYVERENASQFLLDTALKAGRHVQDVVYLDRVPHLSLAMALFRGNDVQFFNVGANRIFFYNGHNERVLGDFANSAYANGRCSIPPGNVIGFFSTGAHAYLHPMERINIIESKGEVFDKAQTIVDILCDKGLSNQLNATVLLVEAMK